jgi:hypothetical protein
MAVAVAATASFAFASAASADWQKLQLTAQGNAIARAGVVQKKDLAGDWTGSVTKSTAADAEGLKCRGYEPKQSDLIRIGASGSAWKSPSGGVQVFSESEVLKTAAMARLDWDRTFGPKAKYVTCFRSVIAKGFHLKSEQVRLTHVPSFPKSTIALIRADAFTSDLAMGGGAKVPFTFNVLWLLHGRTITSITHYAPASTSAQIQEHEKSLAFKVLVRLLAED